MGKKYLQLSLDERYAIARLQEAGQSIRQIASTLDRAASTISREIKHNTAATLSVMLLGLMSDQDGDVEWHLRSVF